MPPSRAIPLTGRQLLTALIAAAGVLAFQLLALPLPFLFGPMFACLLAALAGISLQGFPLPATLARGVLGVAVGAAITPALFAALPAMAISLALIPLYICLIAAIGVPFFHKFCGFDRATAYYAAMPGGLQDMILFGQEAGGDVRALALIHATRVLIIVTVAPVLLTQFFGASLAAPIGQPAAALPPTELAVMALAIVIGWQGGLRIGLFGAPILGPLIVTAALSLGDVIHARPPAEALLAAQYLIGIGIGVSYVGVTPGELRRDVLAGIAFVVILAALAACFSLLVTLAGLAPPLEGFLAFAPGGQAEMAILAIVAGADLGFVVIHHLTRIVAVITLAPLVARLFRVAPGGNR